MKETPVVIRFKGGVPGYILIPHILFMFIAMLFSNLSAILAVFKVPSFRKYADVDFRMFIGWWHDIGKPVVQLYAFGDLWTGIPFGWDLTDNKTLIAFHILDSGCCYEPEKGTANLYCYSSSCPL